jgi:predicted outer membrane repeat protein
VNSTANTLDGFLVRDSPAGTPMDATKFVSVPAGNGPLSVTGLPSSNREPHPGDHLYVPTSDAKLLAFDLDTSLKPVLKTTIQFPGTPGAVLAVPGVVYVGVGSGFTPLRIDLTAGLTPVQGSPFPLAITPTALKADPSGNHLYAFDNVGHSGQLITIDANGKLTVSAAFDAVSVPVLIPQKLEVTSLADNSSPGTLRWAIQQALAAGEGTITFAPGLTGTIALQSPLPTIDKHIAIIGQGSDGIIISGGGKVPVFRTASPNGVFFYGITVTDAMGAGFNISSGSATIESCRISNNSASGINVGMGALADVDDSTISMNSNALGGGINTGGNSRLTVTDCKFNGNRATQFGGAIYGTGFISVSDSVFTGNSAPSGGAVWTRTAGGVFTCKNSTFRNNQGGAVGLANGSTGSLIFNALVNNMTGPAVSKDAASALIFFTGNLLGGNPGGDVMGFTLPDNNLMMQDPTRFDMTMPDPPAPLLNNPAVGGCKAVDAARTDGTGSYRPDAGQPDVCGSRNPGWTFVWRNPFAFVKPNTDVPLTSQMVWLGGRNYAPAGTAVTGKITADGPGALSGATSGVVDTGGLANFKPQLNAEGKYTVTLSGPPGVIPNSYQLFVLAQPPVLTVIDGDGQTVPSNLGGVTLNPVRVNLADNNGQPLVGAPIQFKTDTNGGLLFGGGSFYTTRTDAQGNASANLYAPGVPGSFQVTATAPGDPPVEATFTETVLPKPKPASIASIENANATSDPVQLDPFLPRQICVVVKDANGNPVRGAQVVFGAPFRGPSCIFSQGNLASSATERFTDEQGMACVSVVSNGQLGSYAMDVNVVDNNGNQLPVKAVTIPMVNTP